MRQKVQSEISQLNRQIEQMEQEVVTMADESHTHENVLLQQNNRSLNIASKNNQLDEFAKQLEERIAHQKSLLKTLQMLKED